MLPHWHSAICPGPGGLTMSSMPSARPVQPATLMHSPGAIGCAVVQARVPPVGLQESRTRLGAEEGSWPAPAG
ncbi:hypothetical protein BE20_07955 [Sorangium cellulosum]|nr:hypothetical protein BE20_07955 [Sorangium cellulosum]